MRSLSSVILAMTTALCAVAPGDTARAAGTEPSLLDATSVLAQTSGSGATAAATESPASVLLQDIVRFRQANSTLPTNEAAVEWLALFDRTLALKDGPRSISSLSLDYATGRQVGLNSVLAALPPPASWPTIRKLATERAALNPADTDALSLRLMGELLVKDSAAANATISRLETLSRDKEKDAREMMEAQLTGIQQQLIELYGEKNDIATLFEQAVESAKKNPYWPGVETPDLVGALGADAAEKLLANALRQPVVISVEHGSATHALAKQLAQRDVAALARAQWGLIDGRDTIAFFELMRDRFGGKSDAEGSPMDALFEPGKSEAESYYLIALIVAGRTADAELMLTKLAKDEPSYGWAAAVEAMRAAGQSEALVTFFNKQLRSRPELPIWPLYLQESAYVGHHAQALALLDEILGRDDLPAHLQTLLRRSRIDAQLASDQTAPALKAIRESLRVPPAAGDSTLSERLSDAIKLASLARVLDEPKLATPAFAFAEQSVALMLPKADENSDLKNQLQQLYAELRRQQQPGRAQLIALSVLNRPIDPTMAAYSGLRPDPLKRAALIEIVSIFDAANRPADALQIVDGAASWGVRSVREVVAEADSLGTPIGTLIARSLAAVGKRDEALATTEWVLQTLPGHDGGYALMLELLPDTAAARLDAIYGSDAFQERPLIWKAIALKQQGKQLESEVSVRAAIAIDPSDGEQGRGDRMRAYAILADLLEIKGDLETAGVYRGAVAAIRLSEQADELHALGLYRRAFAGYASALEQFSDAYCIQSRLAVQLTKQGLHEQALQHYRRAYELMPDSFGRVESHCFGCESVFQDDAAQGVAEQVFSDILATSSNKPQAHYMLAYLRIEQGRASEALDPLRQAVALDGDYLNAWKKLNELGEKTYIAAAERDIARLKLIELDPAKRHVNYETNRVGDLAALWRAVEVAQIRRSKMLLVDDAPYPFAASADAIAAAINELPEATRDNTRQYFVVTDAMSSAASKGETPAQSLAKHVLLQGVAGLLGEAANSHYDY